MLSLVRVLTHTHPPHSYTKDRIGRCTIFGYIQLLSLVRVHSPTHPPHSYTKDRIGRCTIFGYTQLMLSFLRVQTPTHPLHSFTKNRSVDVLVKSHQRSNSRSSTTQLYQRPYRCTIFGYTHLLLKSRLSTIQYTKDRTDVQSVIILSCC